MRFSAIRIWLRAISFPFRHPTVLPLLPLLWLPWLFAPLNGILIRDEYEGRPCRPFRALRRACSLVPVYFRLNRYYAERIALWNLVPFYGDIRNIDEGLHAAMASNVLAFEEPLTFDETRKLSEAVVGEWRGEAILVLSTIPLLLALVSLPFFAFASNRAALLGVILYIWWLWFPATAAANNYLYVSIAESIDSTPQLEAVAPSGAGSPR